MHWKSSKNPPENRNRQLKTDDCPPTVRSFYRYRLRIRYTTENTPFSSRVTTICVFSVTWYCTWINCSAVWFTLVANTSVTCFESGSCTVILAVEFPSVPTKDGSIFTDPAPNNLPTRFDTVAFSAPPSNALVVGSLPACTCCSW